MPLEPVLPIYDDGDELLIYVVKKLNPVPPAPRPLRTKTLHTEDDVSQTAATPPDGK